MGVEQTHYVMYGVKVTPANEAWGPLWDMDCDNRDAKCNEHGLDLVVDGMCGEYMVVGKVLASGDQYDGVGFVEVVPPENTFEIGAGLSAVLGQDRPEASLFAFTHFH